MKKQGFYIYFYNYETAKTGFVEITTTTEKRAKELFYKNYNKDYKILKIHN